MNYKTTTRALQAWFWLSLPLGLLLVLGLSGCCHNLQEPYVEQMEATHKAVLLDVEAGLYKPDDKSQGTLDAWRLSNEKAREVLEDK